MRRRPSSGWRWSWCIVAVFSVFSATVGNADGYGRRHRGDGVPRHRLIGWAALDQAARWPSATSGQFIGGGNGVVPPFIDEQPIPGYSGMLANEDGTFTALPDNGYGAKSNSADYTLGIYTIEVDFKTDGDGTTVPGEITNLAFTPFNDINGFLNNGEGVDLVIAADLENYRTGGGFGINSGIPVDDGIVANRLLTGYDFDIESIARTSDGTFWVGEEFGPFLLHFDANGSLIEEPVPHPFLVSPFHPTALAFPGTNTLGASRGFESLAFDKQKELLYVVTESAPVVEELQPVPGDERVVEIFEFDPSTSSYTGVSYKYRKEGDTVGNAIVIGDMTNVGRDRYVLIERDNFSGAEAGLKQLYIINFNAVDRDGILKKRLLLDLLDIRDPRDIGGPLASISETGVPENRFDFPFTSVEVVLPLSRRVMGVAIDTNFPASGRVPDTPDSTEFIKVEFPRPISSFAPRGRRHYR